MGEAVSQSHHQQVVRQDEFVAKKRVGYRIRCRQALYQPPLVLAALIALKDINGADVFDVLNTCSGLNSRGTLIQVLGISRYCNRIAVQLNVAAESGGRFMTSIQRGSKSPIFLPAEVTFEHENLPRTTTGSIWVTFIRAVVIRL